MSAAPPPRPTRLTLETAEETADLARQIAGRLGAGDVLLLEGPLGVGKTHFARALIQARLAEFDAVEDVPSPSYTLVQIYNAGPLEIWHVDLYRLTGVDDLLELGLEHAFESALCIVEWPERLGALAPQTALWLRFSYGGDETCRRLELESESPRWAPLLRDLSGG
jgi:tRNA threonylcarbamoyladenosine biosynthesis protein TsaE